MKYSRYPSRDAIRNYFPLPNEIFQLGLTPGELAVYSFLLKSENRETYQCYPSYRTIGEAVGMSRNTVKKHVDSLVEKRLIYTEPTTVTLKDGTKRNGSLFRDHGAGAWHGCEDFVHNHRSRIIGNYAGHLFPRYRPDAAAGGGEN